MNPLIAAFLLIFLPMPGQAQEEESKPGKHFSLFRTSKDGSKGWTEADGEHSRGGWMNNRLVIVTAAKQKKTFRTARAFIEDWGLTDQGKCVVARSRNAHGPSWIEKFNLATGHLVAECQGSNYLVMTPIWAWAWCDEFGTSGEAMGEGPAEKKPAGNKQATPRR